MPYKDPEKQKQYLAQHYKTNRNTYAASSKSARQRRRDKLNDLKQNPCVDCGESYHPAVMHFHHVDPSAKLATISGEAMNRWSWKRIEEEISKCVLLCSNCHIMRHVVERENHRPAETRTLSTRSQTAGAT